VEFADKPNFTIAGVTDWTAVGGHGSDTTLRTSEALTRETLTLKAEGSSTTGPAKAAEDSQSETQLRAVLASTPASFVANHQLGEFYLYSGRYRDSLPLLESANRIHPDDYSNDYDLALACEGIGDFKHAKEIVDGLLVHSNNGDLHRLAGDLDEKLQDPLGAVREYEQAVHLDPSEQNYFEWGSELLLHRAVWQAQEVFRQGVQAYPRSARMLTALGSALFAGARYEQAAVSLCDASDLNPSDTEPYIFMGKVEMAAPDPLPCIKTRLARFVGERPESALANYLYAMSILKRQRQSANHEAIKRAEGLLHKAVALDAKYADAYLQLGILSYSQREFEEAIDFYNKAIEANPQLDESYYRLGIAYDRIGEQAKARQEFQLHDAIEKQQADAIENQRREIKQFLIVQSEQASHPSTQ
jgi:tetratricopeptide (TPR) repeat protein